MNHYMLCNSACITILSCIRKALKAVKEHPAFQLRRKLNLRCYKERPYMTDNCVKNPL
ncbi:hypothetical protein ECED1_3323 [Escherichia coli ED1a]|uniref:Uncharacterized protein n=1 Tax=Escherichia coli O81 (strain ED1a) TaxID=585397 RepID=B7MZG3_ECO81|nr:hypothetical protein ECED1_3323 [Escherichia coli ED1a]